MLCTTCETEKNKEAFPASRRLKDRAVCMVCKSAYNKSWYRRNREKHGADVKKNNTRYRKMSKVKMDELKSAPCVDCGGTFPPCVMDFDHLDADTKIGNVSRLVVSSLRLALVEVEKCELVCANCHRIRTHNRLGLVAHLDRAPLS